MELSIWVGDWGLPSIDFECLSVLAYCKFSEVPVEIVHTINPWRKFTGDLPVLQDGKEQFTDSESMFDHLRKKNWGTDFDLSPKSSADVVAFTAMVEEKLVPALEHTFWVDSKNFAEFLRPWFARTLWFPLTMIVPNRKHKAVKEQLYFCRGDRYFTEEDREYKIYRDAKECLTSLSVALGDKEYFFGKVPSSFDAIVFGYLAPLMKAPLPNPTLQNHLKACENLCTFCRRILDKYFRLTPEEEAELKQKEEERRKQDTEFPHRTRNTIFASVVAVVAMVVYALVSGLVKIEVADNIQVKSGKDRSKNLVKSRKQVY